MKTNTDEGSGKSKVVPLRMAGVEGSRKGEGRKSSSFEERILIACEGLCRKKDGGCEICPLAGLKVAVIGGLERMLPAYRGVVQQLGAELLFHDGHVRKGAYKLKSLVCGADIVVFITSVNSHGALKIVKAVCKQSGKVFLPIRETGTESLERVLRANAA
ncbi:MAG: DUF2325 domain-containing protein [Acidobacteriota bacterium]